MVRFPTIVTAVFAVFITTAAYAAPTEITADVGQKLTTFSAKEAVRAQIAASGRHDIRPGEAEFVSGGNVDVSIINNAGNVVRHVIVHANDGMITDARSGTAYKG
jgi:hypothetical protein